MLLGLFRFLNWLNGWKVNPEVPKEAFNSVILAAPHTSNWDFVHALPALRKLGLNTKFTIKKEFNKFPLGPMIDSLGALWIDRSPRDGSTERRSYVDVMVELIKNPPDGKEMAVVVTPEGTRGRTEKWKLGFYHVAKAAGVPISFGYMDYENKVIGVAESFMPTDDMEADIKRIMDFYEKFASKAKFPKNYASDSRYS